MKTPDEVRVEIARLSNIKDLDESGLVVRMVTLIAFEWVMGKNPMPPSRRITEVNEDLKLEGVLDKEETNG